MPNKQSGNMYGDIDYTWNIIKGPCGYSCSYCSIKKNYHRFNRDPGKLRLDDKELRYKPKEGKKYFIGSSIDMWHPDVPDEWIYQVLEWIKLFDAKYLFQTKNPERYFDQILSLKYIYQKIELCITVETDRYFPQMGNAPNVSERIVAIKQLKEIGFKTIITIEPVMKFNIETFKGLLSQAKPDKIYIGADSKGCKLSEPSPGELMNLISWLKSIANKWPLDLVLKDNLKRIIGEN